MGKGPEVRDIMGLSRTLKTSVSGIHSGAGVGGKMMENKVAENGWGWISDLARPQQTPRRDAVPSLSLGKLPTVSILHACFWPCLRAL